MDTRTGLSPGPNDCITDVAGVKVGHSTILRGDGPLVVGQGPVRTGVTVVLPHGGDLLDRPLFAGYHVLNGNGELTGLSWLSESGLLTSPIALTNTHSVGVVRDALIRQTMGGRAERGDRWMLPVVGETWDGLLNDINGFHVKHSHVEEALASAHEGPVRQGNVGGGTGMICHGFKGGIGSSSRILPDEVGGHRVGVLVQANHGRRERLTIRGIPVGRVIGAPVPEPQRAGDWREGSGSILGIVATDAPLLPQQCRRLAQRAGLGVSRLGGTGEHGSGDLFVAFSTGNRGIPPDVHGYRHGPYKVDVLHNSDIDPLFDAVIEATEAAIINALLAAETMSGRDNITAYALERDDLQRCLASGGATLL
jgi:D-aminopeptidase